MPLGEFEREVLRLIARNRNPDSFIAGATVLYQSPGSPRDWLGMVTEAEALLGKLPPAEMGCPYLDANGKPVCPDPAAPEFPKLTRHYGSIKGDWPRIVGS